METPSQLQIVKAKVLGFREGIKSATPADKARRATWSLASELNKLRDNLAELAPNLENNLPAHLQSEIGGLSSATYLDLEILSDQLLRIIDLLQSAGASKE